MITMTKTSLGLIIGILILLTSNFSSQKPIANFGATRPNLEVYFSPNGGCEQAILETLDKTETEVKVLAYQFTNEKIAQKLIALNKNIEVILDKSSNQNSVNSQKDFLAKNNIKVYLDGKHKIAHNKVIIIDNKIVITGSYNFSKNAELYNAENLIIIYDKNIAKIYKQNFEKHKDHSEIYIKK